jgi:hypothetical protein
MQLRGIAYAREHSFRVLKTCIAINNLEVINTAGGNLQPRVVKTLTKKNQLIFPTFSATLPVSIIPNPKPFQSTPLYVVKPKGGKNDTWRLCR